jgi:hypothetical protein
MITDINPEPIDLHVDADRLCDAISKIGYTPESALMDLVDNSIAASATHVKVLVGVRHGCTLVMKNAVESYQVVDDGIGMDDSEIASALAIGAARDYGVDSLSKYGMGLKSAGLSLGRKIILVSKKNGVVSSFNCLDRASIKISGRYSLNRRQLSTTEIDEAHRSIPGPSGTIVRIEETEETNQRSPKTIQQNLIYKLGVVYSEFLTKESPLKIDLEIGPNAQSIPAKDILFRGIAGNAFDKDTYDCLTPRIVFDEPIHLSEDEDTVPPFQISIVIFPQERMASYPGFSENQRNQIANYDISAANRGFFIYRNGRLIRWGDDLGIVGKDDRGFRAQIHLKTAHDGVFHVDVSKQRLEISEDLLVRIRRACQLPLRQAREAAELCHQKCQVSAPGSAFNYRNVDLAAEDINEPSIADPEFTSEVKQRTDRIVEASEELSNQDEPESLPISGQEVPVFQKVRYSERVTGFKVWEAGFDPVEGDWVRINRNHSYFETVLQHLDEAGAARQAIEAIFWSIAAAENNTKRKHTQLEVEAVEVLFGDFQKKIAIYLEEWCSKNQDIADDL